MGTFDNPRARLEAKRAIRGDCWIWTGTKQPTGYGIIIVDEQKRRKLTHRLAFEVYKGPIPPGMCVCHRCDVPLCFNPDHLFLGTTAENNFDRIRKGRSYRPKGELSSQAKLTWEQADEIRRRYAAGGATHRQLAADYGVGGTTILDVLHNRKWVRPLPEDPLSGPCAGEK
ncbi:hypothetical protein D3C72_1265650 [compost metagenome]